MKKPLCLLAVLTLSSTFTHGEKTESIPVTIRPYSVEGLFQPLDPNKTQAIVDTGTAKFSLFPSTDTNIVKEKKDPSGSGNSLVLRDNRWTQGLVRLDLASLPPNAPMNSAVFHFKVDGVEKKGTALFQCYRILTDWSEAATWFKPFPEKDGLWNGMKAGTDFETKPFAVFETADLKKGDIIDIPGFSTAIKAWQSGDWKNYGFLITLSGGSVQTSFQSHEGTANVKDLAVGGDEKSEAIAKFDPLLIAHLLVQPDDFLDADFRLRVLNIKKVPADATVRLLSPKTNQVIASASVANATPEGWLEFKGVGTAMREDPSLLIESSSPLRVFGNADEKSTPQLDLMVRNRDHAMLFENEVKPIAGVYTMLKDGHFFYDGKRLRLWGIVGYGEADRLRKMGFNAQRVWDPSLGKIYKAKDFPAEVARRGELPPTVKGDGSNIDEADKHFADLKAHGMFVMFGATADCIPIKPLLDDASFIAGGQDWPEWKAAATEASTKDDGDLKRFAVFFDERLEKVRMKSAEIILNHVNPYTGKRYAEEENIAMYEVWNENGAVSRFLSNAVKLPPYFERKAQQKWSAWLKEKYKTESGLKEAWGRLEAGETLATVKMAPAIPERGSYPEQRGYDYSKFLSDTVMAFNNRYRTYCRSLAPKGVGVNVAPFSFDTQYRPSLPWLYVDAQGDVNCPGMYFWGLKSSLATPPAAYVIDNHTIDGMPTVLYETNQGRPSPFRTEYPIKLAALASWQDWDGVFWHYWAGGDKKSDEEFLSAPMPHVSVTHFWTGVHHENDPVMTSSMAMAGRIFLNLQIKPAPAPTIYHIGNKGIFGFQLANGIGMSKATFQRGAKIKFEPESDTGLRIENEVPDGPILDSVKAGDQILWDWPNARLILDSPTVKAYVGKVGPEPFKFSDGIVLSGINTPWICWVMSSADGKPLIETGRALVSAVYDAKNTDFDFDWTVAGGPVDQAKAIRNKGRAPVVMDQVDYTLSFPTEVDFQFSGYDFALRKVTESKGTNSNVLRVKAHELWMGAIDFSKRGATAPAIVDSNTGAQKELVAGGQDIPADSDAALAAVWNPIPGLQWGDHYLRAHKVLRESSVIFSSISPEEKSVASEKTITWSEAEVLFGLPATIEFNFREGSLTRIAATFTRPPDLKEVVAAYEKQFGPALEKVFTRQEEQSIARWTVKQAAGTVEIRVTEAQGTQVITYELKR